MPSTSRTEEIQLTLCFKKKILARLVMDFKESSTPNFAKYIECILENRYADLIVADRGNVDRHPQPQPSLPSARHRGCRPVTTAPLRRVPVSEKRRAEKRASTIKARALARDPGAVAVMMAEGEA
jgi:hypothetical protein